MATINEFAQSMNALLGFSLKCSDTWTAANKFGITKNTEYKLLSADAKTALFTEHKEVFRVNYFVRLTTITLSDFSWKK